MQRYGDVRVPIIVSFLLGVLVLWGYPAGLPAETATHPVLPSKAELAELPPDGGSDYNRLVFEQSPYLLQHAANPVDWYPWGEDAFARAKQENKPVFLSIGYSTCHWCHVMERESFADAEVARLMAQYFIAVKVDREERPDIDHLYMQVCQRMSRHCGWPLNVIMTPDRKPFYVSTYLPREPRYGRPGMLELLPQVDRVWRERSQEVLNLADRVTASLQTSALQTPAQSQLLKADALKLTYDQLASLYDTTHGGIGQAPKFPKPLMLGFLLRYWKRTGEPQALAMVETTLQAMRRGGIYDHIGFGFHRYATDPEWRVPHFEKMLYNQALLLALYTEVYQATGKPLYAQTAREIATYVLRDMTAAEGGFYSAEDADSEGEEGLFYVWTAAEIRQILGPEEAALFMQVFRIDPQGNFPEGKAKQHNIPHLTEPLAATATRLNLSESDLQPRLDASRQRLFNAREARPHPFKDDKVLTDWNGLMIAALAKAGQALQEPSYTAAAQRAADFILRSLRNEDGRLWKRYRNGSAALPGHVNDYAYLIWGCLDLYEATFDVSYLQAAIDLQRLMLQYFWDDAQGGFFYTASDGEALLVRSKATFDMSIPSGNAVAALNLLRLERITADTRFADRADALLRTFSAQVAQAPASHTLFMAAFDFALGPSFEVVISGSPESPDTVAMLQSLRQRFLPNKVVVFRPNDTQAPAISKLAPFTQNQKPLQGKATAYVCQNFVCNMPTTDPQEMLTSLGVVP
ncbi:MAG: thioredoxin domain-containing protein [Candidatus Tectomicrobia bacterium]|nr:thioredoxin domain-containing protein [Candidatus Tectomicrobia bacterium]